MPFDIWSSVFFGSDTIDHDVQLVKNIYNVCSLSTMRAPYIQCVLLIFFAELRRRYLERTLDNKVALTNRRSSITLLADLSLACPHFDYSVDACHIPLSTANICSFKQELNRWNWARKNGNRRTPHYKHVKEFFMRNIMFWYN